MLRIFFVLKNSGKLKIPGRHRTSNLCQKNSLYDFLIIAILTYYNHSASLILETEFTIIVCAFCYVYNKNLEILL